MNITAYQAELKKMIEKRNGYLVLSSGLLILCLILSFVIIFLSGREKIILVPPSMDKDIWVSTHSASKEYLTLISLSLSQLELNLSPDNVDYRQELLLRQVDSSYYGILKPLLIAEADRIKKDRISTAFFLADIKVNVEQSEAIITGDLKSYVGDTPLPTKRVTYHIVYRISSFMPLITLFEEVKNA